MNKKITMILAGLLLASGILSAQVGVNVLLIKPSSSFGYVYSSNPGIEFTYGNAMSDRNSLKFKLGYFNVKPHQDTFSSYSFNGSSLTPGYKAYSDFHDLYIGMSYDYCFFESDIKPFIGGEFLLNQLLYSYESHIDGSFTSTYSNFVTALTLGIGAGANYWVNDRISLNIGVYKNYSIDSSPEIFIYWKCFTAINVYFFN